MNLHYTACVDISRILARSVRRCHTYSGHPPVLVLVMPACQAWHLVACTVLQRGICHVLKCSTCCFHHCRCMFLGRVNISWICLFPMHWQDLLALFACSTHDFALHPQILVLLPPSLLHIGASSSVSLNSLLSQLPPYNQCHPSLVLLPWKQYWCRGL